MTAFDGLRSAKQAARQSACARRQLIGAAAAPDALAAALGHLLAAVPIAPGAAIAGYWPIEAEFDVRPMLEHFDRAGHPCGLPVVVARRAPLVFRRWRKGDRLVAGRFGTFEPAADANLIEPDVLLVPLLGFDEAGYRLGYGGGFYDRTLATLRARRAVLAVGVAFADQEVAALPTSPTDEPLDWIVTERGARRFAAPQRRQAPT
jgi:5-formyltetrahydrofolate cyclo-ligase